MSQENVESFESSPISGRTADPPDWRAGAPRTKNAPWPRGESKYRYGDSNPGFRQERAAS